MMMESANNGELARKVMKMYEDMYEGDGAENPSVTTRLSLLEDSVEKISSNLSKMVWLLVGIFAAALIDVAARVIWK